MKAPAGRDTGLGMRIGTNPLVNKAKPGLYHVGIFSVNRLLDRAYAGHECRFLNADGNSR